MMSRKKEAAINLIIWSLVAMAYPYKTAKSIIQKIKPNKKRKKER